MKKYYFTVPLLFATLGLPASGFSTLNIRHSHHVSSIRVTHPDLPHTVAIARIFAVRDRVTSALFCRVGLWCTRVCRLEEPG
jgi:hypothetical protein